MDWKLTISYKVTNSHFLWPGKSFYAIYRTDILAKVWNGIPYYHYSLRHFFEIAEDWKQLRCPLIGSWLNQRWHNPYSWILWCCVKNEEVLWTLMWQGLWNYYVDKKLLLWQGSIIQNSVLSNLVLFVQKVVCVRGRLYLQMGKMYICIYINYFYKEIRNRAYLFLLRLWKTFGTFKCLLFFIF